MEILMMILVFAMGTVFGSFFTLAVYRIPLKKDITHERSFCPKCNHRLEFLDLIPVFSYIFLKGKCRYCGEKIRIRYFLLEILSGIVFLTAYMSFNFNFPFYEIDKLENALLFVFFYITLVLIAGIDKENREISKPVLWFGMISSGLFSLYLYLRYTILPYKFVMFFGLFILFAILEKNIKSKKVYLIQLLMLFIYINMYFESVLFLLISVITLIMGFISNIFKKAKQNANIQAIDNTNENDKGVRFGFLFCITSILVYLIQNFTCNWG